MGVVAQKYQSIPNDPVAATDINAERQPYTCKCEAEQEKGDDDTRLPLRLNAA